MGNQDWNLYCLQNYSVTPSQISLDPEKEEIEKGQSVTIYRKITPNIEQAPLTMILIKPDKREEITKATSQEDGAFNFSFIPDKVGNWNLKVWCSGDTYLGHSETLRLTVTEKQESSRVYPVTVFLIIAVIISLSYLFVKVRKT